MSHKKNCSDLIFELTAPEGANYTDFKVNRFGDKQGLVTWYGSADKRKKKTVHLFVKVIGLVDDKAPIRNWGKNYKDES